MYFDWQPYVSVAERRRQAEKVAARLAKQGRTTVPVVISGRKIASTFWGEAWCRNLERYQDYESRLPRGRSYVRNGAVIDLQIGQGEIAALVNGSSLYEVTVKVARVEAAQWKALCKQCASGIDSLVELLGGKLSKAVMERMCAEETGLFPTPREIRFGCTCPDHASMCKHVAAVLYGVGARLDERPELLFGLRQVSAEDLLAKAARPLAKTKSKRVLVADDDGLSALFGVELAAPARPRRSR